MGQYRDKQRIVTYVRGEASLSTTSESHCDQETKPLWQITALIYWLVLIVGLLAGCARLPKEVYRGYSGPDLPDASVAIVDLGKAGLGASIDGMYYIDYAKYGTVKLIPGDHRIEWGHGFAISVLVDTAGYREYWNRVRVTLEAGHAYRLEADRTHGHGYSLYFWIEDMTTGRVVAGTKKP